MHPHRLLDVTAEQESDELILEASSSEYLARGPFLDITTDGSKPIETDRRDWHRFADQYLR